MVLQVSCVYVIRNLKTGGCYVGSTNNFNHRKSQHLSALGGGTHKSLALQRDWDADSTAFEFTVLEEVFDDSLLMREQYWIDFLRPSYNAVQNPCRITTQP